MFETCIIELLGHLKGGDFNIHILAWCGYFICARWEIRLLLFGQDYIVVLAEQMYVNFMKIVTVYESIYKNGGN